MFSFEKCYQKTDRQINSTFIYEDSCLIKCYSRGHFPLFPDRSCSLDFLIFYLYSKLYIKSEYSKLHLCIFEF